MDTLKNYRADYLHKKNKKNTMIDVDDDSNTEDRKRNLEWTLILDTCVKYSNSYCVFLYKRHYFTTGANIGNKNRFFMSTNAHCKSDLCTRQLYGSLSENGRLRIDYVGKIIHGKGKIHTRPIHDSRREELQQFTMMRGTPDAPHLQQLKSMSAANKEVGNRNAVGLSHSVISKISSETNVKLC